MSIKLQEFCRGRYRLAVACIDEIWGLIPKEMQPKFLSVIHRMHSAVSPLNNMIPDDISALDAALDAAIKAAREAGQQEYVSGSLIATGSVTVPLGGQHSIPAQPSPEPQVIVQACRPGDRAMLETDAGKELLAQTTAMLASEPQGAQISDERTMLVPCDEANNYSKILTLLGMEEEGDPVEATRALLREAPAGWRPIETAPKGGGAEMRTDPRWVDPPKILIRFGDEAVSVAYWDWYYAEGGHGCTTGFAWVEPCSGETLDLHYTTPPDGWMPLPAAPKEGA